MSSTIRIVNLESASGFPRYHDLTVQAVNGDAIIIGIEEINGAPSRKAVVLPTEKAKELRDFLNFWIK